MTFNPLDLLLIDDNLPRNPNNRKSQMHAFFVAHSTRYETRKFKNLSRRRKNSTTPVKKDKAKECPPCTLASNGKSQEQKSRLEDFFVKSILNVVEQTV